MSEYLKGGSLLLGHTFSFSSLLSVGSRQICVCVCGREAFDSYLGGIYPISSSNYLAFLISKHLPSPPSSNSIRRSCPGPLLPLPIQMRRPINIQSLLKILANHKLLIHLPLPPQMLHNTHLCVFIRAKEEGHAIPFLAPDIAHTVHSALPRATRNELEEVGDVDDKGVRLRVHGDPDAVCIEDLKGGIRGAGLADEGEPAEVCVGAYADVVVHFLGRVVHCSDVGHGLCGDGVEVGLW